MSNYDDNPNLGCDKAAVTDFLEKIKAHFDNLIPELPTVKAGSSNVDIEETAGPNGELCYIVSVGMQEIPPLPVFCVEDKSGNRIDATIESDKIVINLPPITVCQSNEPATDGSEGCFWFDGICLHVLCDGTWISPDASATTS